MHVSSLPSGGVSKISVPLSMLKSSMKDNVSSVMKH